MKTDLTIGILEVGCHWSTNGEALCFGPEHLAASARAYAPSVFAAPLVLGLPRIDDPAHGWVNRLGVVGSALVAQIDRMSDRAVERLRTREKRRLAASFFEPGAAGNPVPSVYYLKHVALLSDAPQLSSDFADREAEEASVRFREAYEHAVNQSVPPRGFEVDPERLELHRRALVFQMLNDCDYASAAIAVGA